MDRRTVLRAGAWGAAGLASAKVLGACSAPPYVPAELDAVFDCGVVSGLHASDASVIWTRVAPGAASAVDVAWKVASDPGFASVVAAGWTTADPDRDGCVKVLAEGLTGGSTYWYRFEVDGHTSPVGRTRTPAAAGAGTDRVRLAVASCQNFGMGYYPAWRDVAGLDLDAVVHLGDYIYEGGGSNPITNVRADPVREAVTLEEYRAKYRLYRSDPDLRAAHAAHAFMPVWDDHEFVNNCNRVTLAEDPDRAAAAYRAWFEYQPVWPSEGSRIHRRLRFGNLVDLSMLDTRQYRDPEVGQGIVPLVWTNVEPGRRVHQPGRSILGADQRSWLMEGLSAAQADGVTWKVIGNQVMIAPLRAIDLDEPALRAVDPELPDHAGLYWNEDQWDGFQWERDRVLAYLHDAGVTGTAFVTGDIHSFWQAPLRADFDDDRSPVVAQEFVCGSVSSRAFDMAGDGVAEAVAQALRGTRPGFRHVNLLRRGVGLLDCTASSMRVAFRTTNALAPKASSRSSTVFAWTAGTQDVTSLGAEPPGP